MKMAIQYWHDKQQPDKQKFLSLRGGYHGDTFAAMSVCDPVTGMHSLFNHSLAQQFFIDRPSSAFGEACNSQDLQQLEQALQQHHSQLAAFILEPVIRVPAACILFG